MPLPQQEKYTYADIAKFDDGKRYELHEGRLVCMSPAPKLRHQWIVTELSDELRTCLKDVAGRVAVAPVDVRIFQQPGDDPYVADTVLEPDIIVLCDPNRGDDHGLSGAPDLAVEVLSPASRRIDRIIKYELYERAGVPQYWIVDPEMKTVSTFMLNEGRYFLPVHTRHTMRCRFICARSIAR